MPTDIGGQGCGTPSKSWTFGQFRSWANCRAPGRNYGDAYWQWVLSQVQPPLAPPKLSDRSFGDSSYASVLQGHDNSAAGWFGAWLLIANMGPAIGSDLAEAIGSSGKRIGEAAQGTAAGLSLPNPLAAIGDFFSRLGQANTWIRIGQAIGGIILLAVGVARLTSAVPAATKIARVAAKGVLA